MRHGPNIPPWCIHDSLPLFKCLNGHSFLADLQCIWWIDSYNKHFTSCMTYRFIVGIRPMDGKFLQVCGDVVVARVGNQNLRATHACLLLNEDIFEYGPKGWHRTWGTGRDPNFDWETLGKKLQGTTHVSPDQLEAAIKNGAFIHEIYGPYHNCHAFVRECLRLIGAGFFYKGYRKMVMELCSTVLK